VVADALAQTVRIAAIGLVITGLETFAARRVFTAGHPMARSVISLLHRRPLSRAWDRALYPLLAVQVAAAGWLVIFGPAGQAGVVALLLLLASLLCVQWRRTLGGDGAEQMSILIILAGVIGFVPAGSEAVTRIAGGFLVAQLMLSYVTAGVVKLVSPVWRREPILARILGTHRFGSSAVAGYLRSHPKQCVLAQWSVIALELTFPIALFLPVPGMLIVLLAGLCFHIACALLMGLNDFVWAFPAIYPCVYALRSLRSPAG
jgi:hypothetical protein